MDMQEVLTLLARHREELQAAGVKSLAVFRSLNRFVPNLTRADGKALLEAG